MGKGERVRVCGGAEVRRLKEYMKEGRMKFLKNKKGQSATEYAIMVGVIVGIVIIAGAVFKPQIRAAFEQLGAKISGAIGTVSSQ